MLILILGQSQKMVNGKLQILQTNHSTMTLNLTHFTSILRASATWIQMRSFNKASLSYKENWPAL